MWLFSIFILSVNYQYVFCCFCWCCNIFFICVFFILSLHPFWFYSKSPLKLVIDVFISSAARGKVISPRCNLPIKSSWPWSIKNSRNLETINGPLQKNQNEIHMQYDSFVGLVSSGFFCLPVRMFETAVCLSISTI